MGSTPTCSANYGTAFFLGALCRFLCKIESLISIEFHSFQLLRKGLADSGENLPHFPNVGSFQGHSSWLQRRKSWRSNPDGNKYWRLWKNRCVQAIPESVSSERHLPAIGVTAHGNHALDKAAGTEGSLRSRLLLFILFKATLHIRTPWHQGEQLLGMLAEVHGW